MLYVPPISDYKPFYIQKGSETIVDLIASPYYLVVKAHDYPIAFKVKEPYKNQWKDQHGDEEYIGTSGLYFEPFTFKLECALFARDSTSVDTAIHDLKKGVVDFRDFLAGGMFKTFDSWTGFGFQDVRLESFAMPSENDYSVWNKCCRVIFSVTLKVNDPKTTMKLQTTGTATNIVADS